MTTKHLNYLLALKSLERKLEMLQLDGGNSAFFRVKQPFIGYKKICISNYDDAVVELQFLPETIIHIPVDINSLVHNDIYNRWTDCKCRASSAFYPEKNSRGCKQWDGWSTWSYSFLYKPGTMLFPKPKFSRRHNICAAGIHFFLTKQEAQEYI